MVDNRRIEISGKGGGEEVEKGSFSRRKSGIVIPLSEGGGMEWEF